MHKIRLRAVHNSTIGPDLETERIVDLVLVPRLSEFVICRDSDRDRTLQVIDVYHVADPTEVVAVCHVYERKDR